MALLKPQTAAAVNDAYASLKQKYQSSRMWFVILTVTTFVMVALTLILSIWAARVGNDAARIYFLGIAIMTAIVGFLSGLISLFTFGQVARKAKGKISSIEAEEKAYHANINDYAALSDAKARLEAYIRKVTAIANG